MGHFKSIKNREGFNDLSENEMCVKGNSTAFE